MIFTRTVFIYRQIRLTHSSSPSFDAMKFIDEKQNLQYRRRNRDKERHE